MWTHRTRAAGAWITLGCIVKAVFFEGAFDRGMVLRRAPALGLSGSLAFLDFVPLESSLEQVAATEPGT
jgi:hypothetical protein